MSTDIDPNFDQLLIICGIICVIVIGFVLFMIKFPDADNEYTDSIDDVSGDNHSGKDSITPNASSRASETNNIK